MTEQKPRILKSSDFSIERWIVKDHKFHLNVQRKSLEVPCLSRVKIRLKGYYNLQVCSLCDPNWSNVTQSQNRQVKLYGIKV